MGYSISWLAVKGKDSAIIAQQLNISSTETFGDYPQHPLVGQLIPNGWYLLVADRCEHKIISDTMLAKNSMDCSIVACSIEEHVMFFSAALWENGQKIWSITHDSEKDELDLQVEGQPPANFQEIRQRCFANHLSQANQTDQYQVDYIAEIPLEIAKTIVGFRHDELTDGIQGDRFEILRFNKTACKKIGGGFGTKTNFTKVG